MRLMSVLCLLIVAPALAAQEAIPKRPKLPKDADTNDARAYIEWGDLDQTPRDKAHDAYYWAWRLEPQNSAYLLKRHDALYWKQPAAWRDEYDRGVKYVTKSKDARLLDSLWPEILERDPFPYLRSPCYYPEQVYSRDPVVAGLQFYNQRCFRQAAERLQVALTRKPELWALRLQRARALYIIQDYRGAAAEVQVVLDTLRARDDEYLDQRYNTKEFLERMVAAALYQGGDLPGAKAALERALTENLSYYPAHALLSQIATWQGQIGTALQEAELAVGLDEANGVLRHDYGVLLLRSGKLAEAEEQFRRAVELEPYWADARHMLAVTLDAQKKYPEALATYEEFLARAPRRHIRIKEARDRVAALRPGS
jgi:tetratricopeptide (TPR) repeat protein